MVVNFDLLLFYFKIFETLLYTDVNKNLKKYKIVKIMHEPTVCSQLHGCFFTYSKQTSVQTKETYNIYHDYYIYYICIIFKELT